MTLTRRSCSQQLAQRLALCLTLAFVADTARAQPAAESSDVKAKPAQAEAPVPTRKPTPAAATKPAKQPTTSTQPESNSATPAGASAAALASANVEQARKYFKLAVDSYRDGDLATALIEFKRAYTTAPNYRLLYNLGQVSADMRDYPAAERYLTQYLEESHGGIDETRRQAVQEELAKVRTRIAFLHLSSNVEGTELLVDDVVVGRTPLQAPVHVSTGRRRITGRAPGHTPVTQVVDAAGGEDVSVDLTLQPIPSLAAERPIVTRAPERRSSTRKPLLVGLAIGAGVLAAGGAMFAYLAEDDAANFRSALERRTSSDELNNLSDGARTKALVTDFLLGAALLTATVGAVVWLAPGDRAERAERAKRSNPRAARLQVGLGSVHIKQAF